LFHVRQPETLQSGIPRVYDDGKVTLYVYKSDSAAINLHIPKTATKKAFTSNLGSSVGPISKCSLKEYLEELDLGSDSQNSCISRETEVLEDIKFPELQEAFPGIPHFSSCPGSGLSVEGCTWGNSATSRICSDIFNHQHIRRPLALFDCKNSGISCAAYISLPRLLSLLSFEPGKLTNFMLQFISFQVHLLQKFFQDLGCVWHTFDLETVHVAEGGWVQCLVPQLFMKSLHSQQNSSAYFRTWWSGEMSNYDYILRLNKLSGRSFLDPQHPPIFPWVTDFASEKLSTEEGLRDLTRSKYRLRKGDEQLDANFQCHPPHHLTTFLTDLSLYTYRARRTPKCILGQHIRQRFSALEFPNTMHDMYEWTTDECIQEFYSDPNIFTTCHIELGNLQLPIWAQSPQDFIEKHRALLESDAVRCSLHSWIDIVFGHLLSGNQAIKAKNVVLGLENSDPYGSTHGVRQLFRLEHPPCRLKTEIDGGDVTDAFQSMIQFDSIYFASNGCEFLLPNVLHPQVGSLYKAVVEAKQRRIVFFTMPPEAHDILIQHAVQSGTTLELIDRSWLKMNHSSFLATFFSRSIDLYLKSKVDRRNWVKILQRCFGIAFILQKIVPEVVKKVAKHYKVYPKLLFLADIRYNKRNFCLY
jgi:hypothetical protein